MTWRWSRAWVDAAAMALAMLAGTWLGATYLGANAVRSMVEWEAGPAAMAACGRGFVMPAAPGERVTAFFLRQRPAIDCAELTDAPAVPAPSIAYSQRYGLWLAAQAM